MGAYAPDVRLSRVRLWNVSMSDLQLKQVWEPVSNPTPFPSNYTYSTTSTVSTTSSVTTTSAESDTTSSHSNNKVNVGAAIGASIGSVFVVIFILVIVFFIRRKNKPMMVPLQQISTSNSYQGNRFILVL